MAFQAFPIIFRDGHGFDVQSTGLSFTGLGVGMVLAAPFQVVFNRYASYHGRLEWRLIVPFPYRRRYSRCAAVHAGHPPSEIRLEAAQVGAILIPVCESRNHLTFNAHSDSVHSSLYHRIHQLLPRPLDHSHPRLCPLRIRDILLLHLNAHVPRHGLPTDGRFGLGVECCYAGDVRGGVSAVCWSYVWKVGERGGDGVAGGAVYCNGTVTVSALLSMVSGYFADKRRALGLSSRV